MLRQCEGGEGLGQNLLVAAVLITFPHQFIAQNAIALTHLIAGCSHPGKWMAVLSRLIVINH